jgi:hypothetical protein
MLASPALYARGPYRVVAHAADEPGRRFLVIDTAGTWLREEESLPVACDWVDARIAALDAGAPARVRSR